MPPQYELVATPDGGVGQRKEKRNSEESEASDEMRNTIIVQRK